MLKTLAFIVLALSVSCVADASDRFVVEVTADFDADGVDDSASLLEVAGKLEIVIQRGGASSAEKQTLEFEVKPSVQAAVCALPATIEVSALSCSPMDEALPGCRESSFANQLILSGGDCDPILLYWNHTAGQMYWWRL